MEPRGLVLWTSLQIMRGRPLNRRAGPASNRGELEVADERGDPERQPGARTRATGRATRAGALSVATPADVESKGPATLTPIRTIGDVSSCSKRARC